LSAPLFLVDTLPEVGPYTLTGPEGHHAATVQRLRPGQPLLLSDGRGGRAPAVVAGVGRGLLEVSVTERFREPPPAPRIVVVQGIAKGDRGELAVQAMTEVGVDEVVPWAAARSVARWEGGRGERARARWQATAREATKQSRRSRVPHVTAPATTAEVAGLLAGAATALVLHEEAAVRLAAADPAPRGDLVLVVGPEGGIAPEELAAFAAAGAVPVRLGDAVLRTSTAGVAALAVLHTRLGHW